MKTQADHARAYRERRAAKLEKLARYEAALREIDAISYNIAGGIIRVNEGVEAIARKAAGALQG